METTKTPAPTSNGMMNKKKYIYKEKLSPESSSKKAGHKHDIQNDIFSLEDSVADNAKMISMAFTVLSSLYEITSATQKAKLSTEDADFVEAVINKFKATTTQADVLYAKDGVESIDKVFDCQGQVPIILGT